MTWTDREHSDADADAASLRSVKRRMRVPFHKSLDLLFLLLILTTFDY
jgi:hypothetical protein